MEGVRRLAWFSSLVLVACGGDDPSLTFTGTLGSPTSIELNGNVPLVSAAINGRVVTVLTDSGAPITILDPSAVEQALSRFQHAEMRRTTRDVELLGDAIVMREREKSRQKRLKQEPENAGIIDAIDLLSAGAEFVWALIKR